MNETIVAITATQSRDFDNISAPQYRALYLALGSPFEWDAENGTLTRKVRNQIRAAAGFPLLYATMAEAQQAERERQREGRRNKRYATVTQVTPRPVRERITKQRTWKASDKPRKPKQSLLHRSLRTRCVPVEMRDFIYNRDGGRCFYCHCDVARVGAHIDHVFPVARGGKSGYANLVLSCYRCNSSKSASVLENLIDILAEVARRNREFLG